MLWFGNLLNGKTGFFTAIKPLLFCGNLYSDSFFPTANCAAILASGTLVTLLTNGIVLLALGLTSNTETILSLSANWMLIKPLVLSAKAKSLVWDSIIFLSAIDNAYAGNTHTTRAWNS